MTYKAAIVALALCLGISIGFGYVEREGRLFMEKTAKIAFMGLYNCMRERAEETFRETVQR